MFGFRKGEEPVRLTLFAERPPKLFTSLLCDGVTVENVDGFVNLRALLSQLQAANTDCRVLTTLDDPHQAAYTSGHGIMKHELDDTDSHDLSALGAECFEDGEHCGFLTTAAEFPIRLANLKARAAQTSFEDACGVLFWEGGAMDAPACPDTVMNEPDAALGRDLQNELFVQFVPVTSSADALAAFPNGYFTCDLTPMQNYAVARHLEEHHNMKLFGVGASYLGFVRDAPLTEGEAGALACDIVKLYHEAPADAVELLSAAFEGKDWLLLRYTES